MTEASPSGIVLVSACLLGVPCRYDGRSRRAAGLLERLGEATIIPVCPEQLGGLSTPRAPAQFCGGDGAAVITGDARLISAEGIDVTEFYLAGAREVYRIARLLGIRTAWLKEKSPACGVHLVTVDGQLIEGMGVAAAMLMEEGVKLESVA